MRFGVARIPGMSSYLPIDAAFRPELRTSWNASGTTLNVVPLTSTFYCKRSGPWSLYLSGSQEYGCQSMPLFGLDGAGLDSSFAFGLKPAWCRAITLFSQLGPTKRLFVFLLLFFGHQSFRGEKSREPTTYYSIDTYYILQHRPHGKR